jgi:hypothetical protein
MELLLAKAAKVVFLLLELKPMAAAAAAGLLAH